MIKVTVNLDDICQECPKFSYKINHLCYGRGNHELIIGCENRDLCHFLTQEIGKRNKKED